MEITMKIFKAMLVIGFLAVAGIIFGIYSFYQRDINALKAFITAYGQFDQAVTVYSQEVFAPTQDANQVAASESKTDTALADLHTKASIKISSAIKNEQHVMRVESEIADLSTSEFHALKGYQKAAREGSSNLESLAGTYRWLKCHRQAAYAQFQDLGE